MPKEESAKKYTRKTNPMRKIRIEKLCLNICPGEAGDRVTKASKVLEQLTNQMPKKSKSRLTIRSFGIRRNDEIACSVTVRGKKARELLERGLRVKDYELKESNFSETGTFGFGIEEHIDLGLKYDPSTGIFGMDFVVVLARPGLRVSKRKRCKTTLGFSHKVTKKEAQLFFKKEFDGILLKH